MQKTKTIKLLDKTIGSCLCHLITRQKPGVGSPINNILIIRPGGIGDAVLLAPAIGFIKKSCPAIHITVLSEKRNCGVFPLIPGVDRLLRYDSPIELFQAIRLRYDVVIDTEQWYHLSAVIARLIRSPMKIGFDTNQRRRMFTHGIRYDLTAYEPDNFLALLKPLGVEITQVARTNSLSIPQQSISKSEQLLQPLGSDSFVVMFPGASIEEKRWGADRFNLVAKRLAEDGYRVVVVGGREDCSDGDMIAGAGGLNLAGMTSLAETAAVIARSSLVISGDSGVLHLAAALDVPTISLFGPSSVTKWAPRGDKHIVIHHNLPCSPCSTFGTIPPCLIEARCIRDIIPAEVLDAIGRLLPQASE